MTLVEANYSEKSMNGKAQRMPSFNMIKSFINCFVNYLALLIKITNYYFRSDAHSTAIDNK